MKSNGNKNDLSNVPAAACNRCGGWTAKGGMSQHCDSIEAVKGRTGCVCYRDWISITDVPEEDNLGDAEYAAGVADYERWKFNQQMFGESYAAAEELAWNLRYGDW